MCMYLRTKFEVSTIILTRFKQGGSNFTNTPSPTSKQTSKNPTQIRVKPRITNISIGFSSLNIFSSSFLHLLQIIERTNVVSKMYHILGLLNFLHLR